MTRPLPSPSPFPHPITRRPTPLTTTKNPKMAASGGFLAGTMPKIMERKTLAKLLKSAQTKASTLVVDVRDDDREGGHIPGSINRTSDLFESDDDVDSFVKEEIIEQPERKAVVFHCMMSQVRGPAAARRTLARLSILADDGFGGIDDGAAEIFILRGGFQDWVREDGFRKDAELVEDFDARVWG